MLNYHLIHSEANPARLQWACRRGMLELDVLLGNFLNKAYPGLAVEDQVRFVALLNYPDPVLFDWLMGKTVPEDSDMVKMTEMIRAHARS